MLKGLKAKTWGEQPLLNSLPVKARKYPNKIESASQQLQRSATFTPLRSTTDRDTAATAAQPRDVEPDVENVTRDRLVIQ